MSVRNIDYQISLANRIAYELESNDNVVLSCPCGYGKSGVAFQLGKIFADRGQQTLILNHNRVLVNQYEELFKDQSEVTCIKGKANYQCVSDPYVNCQDAICSMISGYHCRQRSKCEYYVLKEEFGKYPIAVSNYQFVFSCLDAKVYNRPNNYLVIADECHNLDSIVSSYFRLSIDKKLIDNVGSVLHNLNSIPNGGSYRTPLIQISKNVNLIGETNYKEAIEEIFNVLKSLVVHVYSNVKDISNQRVLRFIANINEYVSKYHLYCNNPNDYVYSNVTDDINFEHFLVPVHVSKQFRTMLGNISKKAVFMSGTIIDHQGMMANLGIKDAKFIDIPSMFPKENRPVLFCNSVNLNNKNCFPGTPEFSDAVGATLDILKIHAEAKDSGVIFVPSYKLARELYNILVRECRQLNLNYKILTNIDSVQIQDTLERFLDSKTPMRLLISPSFEEGVNFNDDISRFQIIFKTPYLNLGDNRVKAKMKESQMWYNTTTFSRIIQSCARSVRSKKDYAHTYVIDSNAFVLYNKVRRHCPSWFLESVVN